MVTPRSVESRTIDCNVKAACKREFCIRNFTLASGNPKRFVKCQWHYDRDPSTIYLIHRWIMTSIFVTSFTISVFSCHHKGRKPFHWLVHSRNWALLMCMFQAILASIMVTMYYVGKLKRKPSLNLKALSPYKIYWLMNIIALDFSVLIVIRFWVTIYPKGDPIKEKYDVIANVFQHFANPIIMTVDHFMVSHPMQLFQIVYPLCFQIIYDLVSYICYVTGVDSWNDVYVNAWVNSIQRVITSLENCGMICVIHIGFFILQKLRKFMYFALWPYCSNPLPYNDDMLMTNEDRFSLKLSDEIVENFASSFQTSKR